MFVVRVVAKAPPAEGELAARAVHFVTASGLLDKVATVGVRARLGEEEFVHVGSGIRLHTE